MVVEKDTYYMPKIENITPEMRDNARKEAEEIHRRLLDKYPQFKKTQENK